MNLVGTGVTSDVKKRTVKEQCNRLKAWIIHKLGGRTKEEYEKVEAVSRMPIPTIQKTVNFEEYAFAFTWDKYRNGWMSPDDEFWKNILCDVLAQNLGRLFDDGYIKVKTIEDNSERITKKATLFLVKPDVERCVVVYGRHTLW